MNGWGPTLLLWACLIVLLIIAWELNWILATLTNMHGVVK